MTRFLFVTGTDTGVGKTTVSCALLAALRRRGRSVVPFKPIETGIAANDPQCDAARLAHSAGRPADEASYLQFALALAPETAARAAGVTIDPAALVAECRERATRSSCEILLIEGAGGLLVPIGPGYTMADLATALAARVLIIARTRLGTLNHTLLTIAECRRRGLAIAGVVLNCSEAASGLEDRNNAALIAAHGDVPVFGPFPQLPNLALDSLADAAERHLMTAEIADTASRRDRDIFAAL